MSSFEATRSRISALKLSPQGERWVTQALYPPGEHARCAIPTRTHYPTLRIDYRPTTVVSHPAAQTSGNWDLLVYSPPSDATALVIVTAPAGADFEAMNGPLHNEVSVLSSITNLPVAPQNVSVAKRDAAGVCTLENQQVVPNPLRPIGYRITSKSYTAHMTASDLYNSGSVTTCQFDTQYTPQVGYTRYGAARMLVPCLASVPLDETEITSSSPYAVVSEAKDGIFVPHRLMGPSFDFVKPTPSHSRKWLVENTSEFTVTPNAANAPMLGVAPAITNDLGTSTQPWWIATAYALATRPDDLGFDSVTTGISIFRGLNFEATITFSVHIGLEYLVQAESPFRTMVTDPDEPDSKALTAYYEIAQRMPHAYPASYNALGLVLPAIASAVRAVLPHLPKLLPIASAALPEVAKLFKTEKKIEKSVKKLRSTQGNSKAPRTTPSPRVKKSPWSLGGPAASKSLRTSALTRAKKRRR